MIRTMPRSFRAILAGALLLVGVHAATPAPDQTGPVEWIVEDGTMLTLRLVLEERGRPCGGELVVDPNRRTLRFEGVPGAIGCRRFVEASFTDLEDLRVQRHEAGFELKVGGDKKETLVLLPLPHFRWFAAQRSVRQGGLDRQFSSLGLTDPDGEAIWTGGPAAPSVERVPLPREVVADTEKAVELIREAMGRPPAPADVLWEALYGRPVDTTVTELLELPGSFASLPIRVRARLLKGAYDPESLFLGSEGATIPLAPEPDAEARFAVAGASWAGQHVEVVGRLRRRVFTDDSAMVHGVSAYYISGWQCIGPETRAAVEGQAATLEDLFARPDDFEGEVLRVQGCFRGRNARGDLPNKSQKSAHHWIIKSGRYAIWVTGHKPAGEGWELDLTIWTPTAYARSPRLPAPASSLPGGCEWYPALQPPPHRSSSPCLSSTSGSTRARASSCSSTGAWTSRASPTACACATQAMTPGGARSGLASPTTSPGAP
jgi:hypothetical protein